jgi:hypothetical protein
VIIIRPPTYQQIASTLGESLGKHFMVKMIDAYVFDSLLFSLRFLLSWTWLWAALVRVKTFVGEVPLVDQKLGDFDLLPFIIAAIVHALLVA